MAHVDFTIAEIRAFLTRQGLEVNVTSLGTGYLSGAFQRKLGAKYPNNQFNDQNVSVKDKTIEGVDYKRLTVTGQDLTELDIIAAMS